MLESSRSPRPRDGVLTALFFALLGSASPALATIATWNGGWPPIAGSYNNTNDHNLPLSASAQESPPAITLTFHKPGPSVPTGPNGGGYTVYRKLRDDSAWGNPIAMVSPGATAYIDTSVSVGVAYEYKVTISTSSPFGAASNYIVAGIRVDQTAPRGRLVLVVTETIANGMPDDLAAYVADLGAEGWTVHTLVVPAGDYNGAANLHQPIRASIQALHVTYPGEIKNVVLLGRVPVVRSGIVDLTRPDGHANSYAEAADAYYAEMDGNWTDIGTNASYSPANAYFINIPGDGKYDASKVSDLGAGQKIEFGFGRVDFSALQGDELAATRLYFQKLARYRRVSPDFQPGRRAAIRKGFDNVDETGWNTMSSLVGPGNILAITNTNDLPADASNRMDTDALITREDQRGPFLFYFKGSGSLGRREDDSRAVFWTGMQSHWGYWADYGLGQMTSRTSADSYTLSYTWNIWALRYLYHRLGLGGDMGDVLRTTINNTSASSGLYPYVSANMPWGDRNGRLWISHIGDPTLRLFPVRPPTALAATPSGASGVTLSWTDSTDTGLVGVHLYRAPTAAGPWTRLTPAGFPYSGNSYTDTPPSPGAWVYSIRAVKLEDTPCGTYLNPSLGATIAVNTATATQPLAITTASLPASAWQTPSKVKLTASGGNPPYVWSLAGGSLPAGLSLASDGTISGSPIRGGVTAQPVFKVTDFRGATAQLACELGVTNRRTVVVPVEADTQARSISYETGNFGLTTSLLVVKAQGQAPYNSDSYAYLRFALPALAPGERLEEARLRLYLGDGTVASSYTTTLSTTLLADNADAWEEGALDGTAPGPTEAAWLTFKNRPISANPSVAPIPLFADFAAHSRIGVDVLPLCLETLANDSARKLGLLLSSNTVSGLQLCSRENPPETRPVVELEITHAPLITVTRPLTNAVRIPAGQGLALRASVTDSVPVANAWTQLSGPGAATFSSASSPETDVTFSTPGRYSLRLASDDGVLVGQRLLDVRVVPAGDTTRTDGLVLHHRFDENSGTSATDTSSDAVAHIGTLISSTTNGLQWAPAGGRLRGALQFAAANSYVAVADQDTLDNTNRLSVALWVKPSAAAIDGNTRGLISKRNNSNSSEAYTLYLQNGRVHIRFSGNNATRNTVQPVVSAGRWTHLAAVFDGTQVSTADRVTLYVDGVPAPLAGPLDPDTTIPNHPSPLWIGQMGGGSASFSYLGLIDDVRIYRGRALGATDVADLFAAEAPRLAIIPPATSPDSGATFMLTGSVTDAILPSTPAPLSVLWTKSAGAPAVSFTTPTATSTDSTAIGGGFVTLRLTGDDGAVATFVETSLTITASVPNYAAWAGSISWPVGTDSTATGDPDGDGLANLLEFALAVDPLIADPAEHRPALSVVEGHLALSFTRDPALATLTYEVQASPDLSAHSWLPIARSIAGAATADVASRSAAITETSDGDLMRVTVQDAASLNGLSRRFLRLHVTQP